MSDYMDDRTIESRNPFRGTTTPEEESKPILLQYDGNAPGKRFVLTDIAILIGRKADRVQVWIDDASVSREHCRIEFKGQRAMVTDLSSKNHTYVNDTEVTTAEAELCHSDILRVGDIHLRYFAHGCAEQLLFDKIYRMAVQDRMLEIFRKDYMQEKLDEEFRFARVKNTALSVIFMDLDKFKNVNDTYGHDAGDLVLKEVCNAVKPTVRKEETFGRFGGEEFCLVLPRTPLNEATAAAERIRQTVQKIKIVYKDVTIAITASLGVATLTPAMISAQDLLKLADEMVYASKKNGRNCVTSIPAAPV